MTRQWSTYQQAIFAAVETSNDNLAINAVAGSGKTTTLVEVSSRIPRSKRVVFVAFNKHIVKELQVRMQGVDCSTIHSLGYKAVARGLGQGKKVQTDEHKYGDLIKQMLEHAQDVPVQVFGQFVGAAVEIADKARLTLTDLNDRAARDEMIAHFGILADLVAAAQKAEIDVDWLERKAVQVAQKALDKGLTLYRNRGVIDFTDMIYLPAKLGLAVPQYDVVLIDEAQDLNAAQLTIVLAAAGKYGRIVAVGDPRQAIMGFSGADNRSFQKIVAATRARELPLSVCYRCPVSHLDLARQIVPHIEAAPGACDGTVESITLTLAAQMVRQGDLFVCRTNAPLVSTALKFIAQGVQARVRGRNIASGLVRMIDDAEKIVMSAEATWRGGFAKQLARLVEIRVEMLAAKEHSEQQQETVVDSAECIFVFLQGNPDINDSETLKARLQALFADEGAAVWLSSIHRAKGLEADNVYILRPDRIRLSYKGMLDWQAEQEANLEYVAKTRAKKALYFVQPEMAATSPNGEDGQAPDAKPEDKRTVGDSLMAARIAARFEGLLTA